MFSLVCHLTLASNVRFTHPSWKRVNYPVFVYSHPNFIPFFLNYVFYTYPFYASKAPYSDVIIFQPFFGCDSAIKSHCVIGANTSYSYHPVRLTLSSQLRVKSCLKKKCFKVFDAFRFKNRAYC